MVLSAYQIANSGLSFGEFYHIKTSITGWPVFIVAAVNVRMSVLTRPPGNDDTFQGLECKQY